MRNLAIVNQEDKRLAIQTKLDRCRRLSKDYPDGPTAHHIRELESELRKQLSALRQRSEQAGQMPDYRAYTTNGEGHFTSFRAYSADSDKDAIEWAKQMMEGRAIEICSGTRLVKTVPITKRNGRRAQSRTKFETDK